MCFMWSVVCCGDYCVVFDDDCVDWYFVCSVVGLCLGECFGYWWGEWLVGYFVLVNILLGCV